MGKARHDENRAAGDAALRDPSSALGAEINASADYLTAAICVITGNQPASACSPAVRTLQPRLGR